MSVFDGKRRELRRILYQGMPQWATQEGDDLVFADGRHVREEDAVYLPPCDPTKIIAVHVNFDSRRRETNPNPGAPREPTYFQKPLSALNAHRGALYRPSDCQYVNYEGEVAAIIGKPIKGAGPDEVWDALAGFACANDAALHDFRETDNGSMLRVKGTDGFCPLGPGIVSGVDPRESTIRTYVNGELRQEGKVSELIKGIDYLIADLNRYMTFLPGDVILTGTPAFSRPMEVGDVVEVDITNIGRLTNTLVEIPAAKHRLGHQPTDTDAVRRICLGADFVPRDEKKTA